MPPKKTGAKSDAERAKLKRVRKATDGAADLRRMFNDGVMVRAVPAARMPSPEREERRAESTRRYEVSGKGQERDARRRGTAGRQETQAKYDASGKGHERQAVYEAQQNAHERQAADVARRDLTNAELVAAARELGIEGLPEAGAALPCRQGCGVEARRGDIAARRAGGSAAWRSVLEARGLPAAYDAVLRESSVRRLCEGLAYLDALVPVTCVGCKGLRSAEVLLLEVKSRSIKSRSIQIVLLI